MPAVPEPAPITRVFGVPREGMKRHVFVAANFFMQRMLNRYRDDLEVDGAAAGAGVRGRLHGCVPEGEGGARVA